MLRIRTIRKKYIANGSDCNATIRSNTELQSQKEQFEHRILGTCKDTLVREYDTWTFYLYHTRMITDQHKGIANRR